MTGIEQFKDLDKYSQLFLDTDDWQKPVEITDNGKVVAYLINRKIKNKDVINNDK